MRDDNEKRKTNVRTHVPNTHLSIHIINIIRWIDEKKAVHYVTDLGCFINIIYVYRVVYCWNVGAAQYNNTFDQNMVNLRFALMSSYQIDWTNIEMWENWEKKKKSIQTFKIIANQGTRTKITVHQLNYL